MGWATDKFSDLIDSYSLIEKIISSLYSVNARHRKRPHDNIPFMQNNEYCACVLAALWSRHRLTMIIGADYRVRKNH